MYGIKFVNLQFCTKGSDLQTGTSTDTKMVFPIGLNKVTFGEILMNYVMY